MQAMPGLVLPGWLAILTRALAPGVLSRRVARCRWTGTGRLFGPSIGLRSSPAVPDGPTEVSILNQRLCLAVIGRGLQHPRTLPFGQVMPDHGCFRREWRRRATVVQSEEGDVELSGRNRGNSGKALPLDVHPGPPSGPRKRAKVGSAASAAHRGTKSLGSHAALMWAKNYNFNRRTRGSETRQPVDRLRRVRSSNECSATSPTLRCASASRDSE